ncbi:hypothetical protein I5535_21250 [Rhodobacteraceae bacterium F11138]|nr:hypothetical protein [Rhodobacteraceae bacterium F11138]
MNNVMSWATAINAPSLPLFGSFFPYWLLCLFAAVILTVLIRVVLVFAGIDDILRWRVVTYMSLSLSLTYVISFIFFGR